MITEITGWKQALNTFYIAKGRLPSDANNDGKIGLGSDEGKLDHYFPAPYNGHSYKGEKYNVWNGVSGPFVDLYLSKLTNFKPTMSRGSMSIYNIYKEHGLPESQSIKNDNFYYFAYIPAIIKDSLIIPDASSFKDITSNALVLNSHINNNIYCSFIKKLESKVDDNKIDSGSMRSSCAKKTSYNDCNDNTKCTDIVFKLDI